MPFLLLFFTFFTITTGFVAFLFKMTLLSSISTLLLSAVGSSLLTRRTYTPPQPSSQSNQADENKNPPTGFLWIFLFLNWVGAAVIGTILFKNRSFDFPASPWQILPWWIWILFFTWFLVSIIFLFLVRERSNTVQKYLLLVPVFLISFSILSLLFPLGSDYDPYIHRAAETALVEYGSIAPRTVLYSGEYGLVSSLSLLTHLPVKTINIWLLPILATLILPWFLTKRYLSFTALAFLFLPFSFLTVTVPQGLGMLFLLVLIFEYWKNRENEKSRKRLTAYFLFACAAFICHPFPGIAAFIFFGGIAGNYLFRKTKIRYLSFVICHLSFSSFLLPLALFLNDYRVSEFKLTAFAFHPERIEVVRSFFHFGWVRYVDPLSFVELFSRNYWLFFFSVVALGIYFAFQKVKTHSSELRNRKTDSIFDIRYSIFVCSFFSLLVSSLLILFFFQFNLTDLETRQIFERIFTISILFLFPFFLETIECIIQKYKTGENSDRKFLPFFFHTSFFCCIALLLTGSLYLQYPRVDRYENFKGFNVSQGDIETVHLIEKRATTPYLALANQQLGAAALNEFGFLKYVPRIGNGKQYFYSIPISSRAHELFLEIMKTPTRESIQKVFREYEISELTIIVSPYWKKANWIAGELEKIADEDFTVEGNRVFKFQI